MRTYKIIIRLVIVLLMLCIPMQALAEDSHALSRKLYAELSKQSGNLFFSPYSVSEALAMTYVGAGGKTAVQMRQVCGFSSDDQKTLREFSEARKKFEGLNAEEMEIHIANSLWPEKTFSLRNDFLATLKQYFATIVEPVDFIGSAERAAKSINAWVSEKTKNKINDLILPGVLTSDTRLVLINAIYFKAKWSNPFKESATHEADFVLTSGEKKKVQMMTGTGNRFYVETEQYQAASLPYEGPDIAMVVVVPKEGVALSKVEGKFIDGSIAAELSKVEQGSSELVTVFLPKFRLDWGTKSLKEPLQHLGMTEAFERTTADFSRMSDAWKKDLADRLYVTDVLHKAFVVVSEAGTEAAAATAVVMARAGAAFNPEPPKVIRADRPFLILIRAQKSGTILFVGRVADPAL